MKAAAKIISFCSLAFALLMVGTRPDRLPSALLVVPFIFVFIILALGVALVLAWKRRTLTFRAVRAGCMAAILPAVLLVLRSVGQLTLRDTLTILLLFGITYFYMARINATAH